MSVFLLDTLKVASVALLAVVFVRLVVFLISRSVDKEFSEEESE